MAPPSFFPKKWHALVAVFAICICASGLSVSGENAEETAPRELPVQSDAPSLLQSINGMHAGDAPPPVEVEDKIRTYLDQAEAHRQGNVHLSIDMAKATLDVLDLLNPRDEAQRELFLIFEYRSRRILGEVAEEREQDAEATKQYKRILDIALEISGPESDVTASWRAAFDRSRSQPARRLKDAAFSARLDGDYEAALPLYQQAYQRWYDILGSTHPDTIEVMRSIANTQSQLGRVDESIRLTTEVLASQKPDDPNDEKGSFQYVSDLVVLADYQDQAGLYYDAGQSLELANTIAQDRLPITIPLRLTVVNNLAINLFKRGEIRQAAPALRIVLGLQEEMLGAKHPETVTTMANLGTVLDDLGEYAEAEFYLRRAYETSDDAFGPNIPQTLTLARNLAGHLKDRGRYSEAEEMYDDIIRRQRVQIGPTHPGTLMSLNNMADLLALTGRTWEAEQLFREVLGSRETVLGPMHPDTLVSLNNLASILKDLGRSDTAEAEFERVLAARLEIFGPTHPDVIRVMVNLAGAREENGRLAEAEVLLRDAYDAARRELGPNHPLTLSTSNNLSQFLANSGKLAEAVPLARSTHEGRVAILGERDPNTLRSAVNLAGMYRKQKDHAAAVALLEPTVGLMIETLGEDNLDVLTARNNLSFFYNEMGQPERALVHARAAMASRVPDALAGLPLSDPRLQSATDTLRIRGRALAMTTWAVAEKMQAGASEADGSTALLQEGFLAIQTTRSAAADALSRSAGRIAGARRGLGDIVAQRERAQSELTALDEHEFELAKDADLDAQARLTIRADIEKRRAAALSAIDDMDTKLRRSAPEFFGLISPDPVSVDELQGRPATNLEQAADSPLLRADEALILITPPDRGFPGLVWAISQESAAWSTLQIPETDLSDRIARLHDMLDSPGLTRGFLSVTGDADGTVAGFDRTHAHDLYRDLLGDEGIQQVLKGKSTWIIAPQGMLLSLPFATLVSEAPAGGAVADADPAALRQTSWLGLERAIAVIPEVASLRTARSKQPAERPEREFFGVGDPIYAQAAGDVERAQTIQNVFEGAVANPADIARLSPLPGTRAEIEEFATYFKANSNAVLLGSTAREAELAKAADEGALSEARIVVLATHGLLAGAFEGLGEPALAFSPPPCGPAVVSGTDTKSPQGDPVRCDVAGPDRWNALQQALSEGAWIDDGLLTATEAAQLELKAEWVILSACDTAGGDRQTPDAEGLSGLAQAFFHAGAQSLLVSHWPVRDDVAARLTTQAVAGADNGLSRAEALQEAMRALVMDPSADDTGRSFAHPAAWAAFQVTGHS